jgi:molybdopterin-binding protein
MKVSARNQLSGRIASLKIDELMAEVVIEFGDGQQLVSIVTRASAEGLGLKQGDMVTAIVKATDVMVGK